MMPTTQPTMIRELVYSYRTTSTPQVDILSGPAALAGWLRPMLQDEPVEVVVVVVLDNRGRPICWHVVSRGTLNAAPVHPRDVFRPAISANGASVVLAHNHPSGDLPPSAPDRAMSKRPQAAGELLGITFQDSIIVSNEGYVSLREIGLL